MVKMHVNDRMFAYCDPINKYLRIFTNIITCVIYSGIGLCILQSKVKTIMWANAQRDGRPAEHRWRPLFNAAKFG